MIEKFCPSCGEPRLGAFAFCRRCGLDFDALVASAAIDEEANAAAAAHAASATVLSTKAARAPSAASLASKITAIRSQLSRNALLVAASAIFVAVLLRNSGLYPIVMGDEQLYASLSRLFPLSTARVPDYLYLAIFSLTNQCGDGFLACARILNLAAFMAALPFIYLTARRVCSRSVAILATVLALTGPVNTYTAYFMPEALYFLSFWVVVWYVLGIESVFARRMWIVAGVLIGAASLVKPHGLFLIPAILLYLLVLGIRCGREGAQSATSNGVLVVASALLTKFAGGFVLAGAAGLTLFGATYGSAGASAVSDPNRAGHIISDMAGSLLGHTLAMSLLYGLPLAISVLAVGRALRTGSSFGAEERTSVFTFLIVGCLVVITALFTALVAGIDPLDTATRLHMRYYDFAIPLLMIVAAPQVSDSQTRNRPVPETIVAGALSVAIIYALISHLEPFKPALVDSPELFGITVHPALFIVIGCLSLGALALWLANKQWGRRVFFFAFLPVVVAASSVAVSIELRRSLVPDQADRAGMFVRQYLPREVHSRVVVVGSNVTDVFRALFYVDDREAGTQVINPGIAYDLSTLPEGKEWALILGDHAWTGGSFSESLMTGFALVRRNNPNVTVDFTMGSWPGVIARAQGLSEPEPEGTWSDGEIVTLEFATDLPAHFELHITAAAFGPNVGRDFIAKVGTNATGFTLETTLQERVLDFRSPVGARTVEIEVPRPTSPSQLGLSADTRLLGIRLATLRIAAAP